MFHADGRTDMMLIVTFRHFAHAPKNQKEIFDLPLAVVMDTACYSGILEYYLT
jgi:hypothetical protein